MPYQVVSEKLIRLLSLIQIHMKQFCNGIHKSDVSKKDVGLFKWCVGGGRGSDRGTG